MLQTFLKRRETAVIALNGTVQDNLSALYEKAEVVNNSFSKRFFDVIFTSILFIFIFSWLFPIIILLIKSTSKGPVFFKQQRNGVNNTTFTCYKFRTMFAHCPNIDEQGNYLQAKAEDPRVTPVGKLLRKTSLDELPQFYNVLMGNMSIIGPRPHPIELNEVSEGVIENYTLRYLVKPGVTGWAQVSGYRGPTQTADAMQGRVNHDIWYIQNWSFWLDMKIVLLTLKTAFWGDKNAV
ncbi:MAG: sugar transferase [Bacteroidota bacterium]|nr:sugar transferase [Bacteroidota bacterium]